MTRGSRAATTRVPAGVPFVEGGLFAPCPVAGCAGITETEGQPCTACQELFGDYLTRDRSGGRSMTSQQVSEHKAATLETHRRMHTAPAPAQAPSGPERKQNQVCWICEERHTCTRMSAGWECDTCAQVTR
jgi:hypothetical protein